MAKDLYMFQYLKEKIDKGFPEPKYPDLIPANEYLYVPRGTQRSYLSPQPTDILPSQKPAGSRVAMFFDGPFFPIRNGVCYTIHNLMKTLGGVPSVNITFINCYRGWDEIESYYDRNFSSTFMNPDDFYADTGVLEQAMLDQGIQIAHFFDTEVLITLAPRLRKLGIKIVLETQNIDHVLLERLNVPQTEVDKARDIQIDALKMADFNLFRSAVDMEWGLKLGANPETAATYRGGICVDDFTFMPRTGTKELVFLGHMFYQPNENALNVIISEVLPRLDDEYTLTVIGITPPKLIEKHKDVPNVTFKKGVDDLDASLRQFDIALAPLLEGSGTRLKLLDYLASGLPVVATSLASEGLDPKINAYMIIEDKVDAYADRIKEIAENLEVAQERSRQGRAFIEAEYDWPHCIQPFLEAYQKLE